MFQIVTQHREVSVTGKLFSGLRVRAKKKSKTRSLNQEVWYFPEESLLQNFSAHSLFPHAKTTVVLFTFQFPNNRRLALNHDVPCCNISWMLTYLQYFEATQHHKFANRPVFQKYIRSSVALRNWIISPLFLNTCCSSQYVRNKNAIKRPSSPC
jgi:hypothetical protein